MTLDGISLRPLAWLLGIGLTLLGLGEGLRRYDRHLCDFPNRTDR